MIRLRGALDAISPYVPGRAQASGLSEDESLRLARLASNERPIPPPPSVLTAISEAAAEVNRYPDDDVSSLREALSRHLGVPEGQLLVGGGSSEILLRCVLATVDPGCTVVHAAPSFVMYPILAALAGAEDVAVPVIDARHDLDGMAAAVDDRTRVVFVCTPNNPTGTSVTRSELESFLNRVPGDVLVVLDEAYFEYVDGPDALDGMDFVEAHPNVVATRTFSKAWGLAGLRVGYGIAHPDVAALIDKARQPFTVNSVAQAAAIAALDAVDGMRAHVNGVRAERDRVRRGLLDAGFNVPPSDANFVWLPVPGRARDCETHCEAAGVLVRPVGPDAVRVTVGTTQENDRALGALTTFSQGQVTGG